MKSLKIVMLLFLSFPLSASRARVSPFKKSPLLRGMGSLMKAGSHYIQDTTRFYYHGLVTKKCSKKERKKAKKNFRWYRNATVLLGILGGAKWKIDTAMRNMEREMEKMRLYLHNELPDIIIDRLDNPSQKQLEVEDAIGRKISRKINEAVEKKKKEWTLYLKQTFPVMHAIWLTLQHHKD